MRVAPSWTACGWLARAAFNCATDSGYMIKNILALPDGCQLEKGLLGRGLKFVPFFMRNL